MIQRVKQSYPNASVFGTTLREVVSADSHLWGIIMSEGDNWHVVEPRRDHDTRPDWRRRQFVSGLLYAILKGWEPEKMDSVPDGNSGALVTTLLTDYAQPADEEQIWSIWKGNARVSR